MIFINKKILVFNIASGFGGAEKSLIDILKKFPDNYEIHFIVENKKMIKLLDINNYSYTKVEIGSLKKVTGLIKYIYWSIRILLIILKQSPDIIISNTIRSHILSSPLSLLLHIELIWVLRDYQFNKIFKKMLEFIPKKIICVSKHLKKFYNGNEKYIIIPNGIEVNSIEKNNSLKYRYNYDIKEDDVVFGIASTFARWKGIEFLIKAFYNLKTFKENFNGKLLIAGKPKKDSDSYNYYKELRELVTKLSLEEVVLFVGWVDDPIEFFYNCDVVVSSSISKNGGPESFGRTIIESWSVKKPVIATNVGGPKEIIEDFVNGIKVQEQDIRSMEKALWRLHNNKKLRFKLGNNGYKNIINLYDIDKISLRYLQELKS